MISYYTVTLSIKTFGFYLDEVCLSSHTYPGFCLSVLNLFPVKKESEENVFRDRVNYPE